MHLEYYFPPALTASERSALRIFRCPGIDDCISMDWPVKKIDRMQIGCIKKSLPLTPSRWTDGVFDEWMGG